MVSGMEYEMDLARLLRPTPRALSAVKENLFPLEAHTESKAFTITQANPPPRYHAHCRIAVDAVHASVDRLITRSSRNFHRKGKFAHDFLPMHDDMQPPLLPQLLAFSFSLENCRLRIKKLTD